MRSQPLQNWWCTEGVQNSFINHKHTTELSEQNKNIVGLVFDYMQNVDLPKIPVQEVFYLRQLTLQSFVFIIQRLNNHIFTFTMKVKQRNDVTSFIINYIKEMVPIEVNELHLFSDNCWGQNKTANYVKFVLLCVKPVSPKLSSNSFHWEDTPTILEIGASVQ